MAEINKYDIKDFRDPIAEADTLIGSSSFTKKTKNFILKDLIAFVKMNARTNEPIRVFNETPIGILNGSNNVFTSNNNFIPETLTVFVNGIFQKVVADFQTVGNNTIIFSFSLGESESILINYTKL